MKKWFYLSALFLAVTGCTGIKMAVDKNTQASLDEYKVKGREGVLLKQQLSFGEYKTDVVKRSWTKDRSFRPGIGWGSVAQQHYVNLISMEYIDRKQTVHFGMHDKDIESQVFCVSKFRSKDLQAGKSDNSILNIGLELFSGAYASESLYYVQIYTNKDGGLPWQLLLDNNRSQSAPQKYLGYLERSPNEYYTITPVRQLTGKDKAYNLPFGSVGYEIRNGDDKLVAAVSTMDRGTIYIAKTNPEERFLMANTCAAILLQQQIGD